jgi:hypothetical protein
MAYASGQLNDDELSARLDRALRAKTMGELDPILADLNFASMGAATPAQAVVPVQPAPVPVRKRRHHRLVKAVGALIVAGALVWGVGTAGHALGIWDWQPNIAIGAGANAGADAAKTYTYNDMDALTDLTVDVGNSTVDFSSLDVTRDGSMSITQDVGNLQINLPTNANVVMHYTTDVGSVSFTGGSDSRSQGGVGASGTCTWTRDPGGPTLTLDVTADAGNITAG